MFSKLFKPKWRHRDAQVRQQAINAINPSDQEQHLILEQLARSDQSAKVRESASAKLTDATILWQIFQTDSDETVRLRAKKQLFEQVLSNDTTSMEERLAIIAQIDDTQLLHGVLKHIKDLSLGQQLIEKNQGDQAQLASLAVGFGHAQLRLAAAEKISDRTLLEQVAKEAKSKDKSVYRQVKTKLTAIQKHHEQCQSVKQHLEHICLQLETHAAKVPDPLYQHKLEHLRQQFTDTVEKTPDTLLTSIDITALESRLSKAFDQGLEQWQRVNEAIPSTDKESSDDTLSEIPDDNTIAIDPLFSALSQELDQSSDALKGSDPLIWSVDLSLEIDRYQQQLNAADFTAENARSVTEKISFLKQCNSYQQHIQHQQQLVTDGKAALHQLKPNPDANNTIDPEILRLIKSQLKAIDLSLKKTNPPQGIATTNIPDQLAELAKMFKEHQTVLLNTIESDRKIIQEKLSQADTLIQEGKSQQAAKLLKNISKRINVLNELGSTKTLKDQYNKTHSALRELKDWQGFATTPKKQQLCEQMEALIDKDIDPQAKADEIKTMQEQWKELGSSDPKVSQMLWERFKKAADIAYQPCHDYFKQQALVRKDNLSERINICQQLAQYIEQANWHQLELKAVEKVLDLAFKQWQQAAPVERSANKPVQQRFHGLINQLKQQVKNYHEQHLQAKEALIRKASTLDNIDTTSAIEQAKQLQKDWQDSGHAGRQDQKLWQTFRSHIDPVFEKRHAEFAAHKQQQIAVLSQAQQLLEAASQLTQATHETINQGQLQDLNQQFQALDLPKSKDSKLLISQFKELIKKAQNLIEQHKRCSEDQARKAHLALSDHIHQLEFAIITHSQEDDSQAKALLESLQQQKITHQGLANRLEKAQEALNNPSLLSDECTANQQKKADLCFDIEIALSLESPDELRAERIAYQVNKLSKSLQHGRDHRSLEEQIKAFEDAWISIAALKDAELDHAFNLRFTQGLNTFHSR